MNRSIVTAILIGGAFVSAGAAVAGLGLQSAARACADAVGLASTASATKREPTGCAATGTTGATAR